MKYPETPEELFEEIENGIANENTKHLESLLKLFEFGEDESEKPFSVSVQFKKGVAPNSLITNTEGDTAIAAANGISRGIRWLKYKKRRLFGYAGPIIVSEGDSWFQYPKDLHDVIDCLMAPYAVCSLGGAGHLLQDMLQENEYTAKVQSEAADFFLISGGGNDMVHSGRLATYLNKFQQGMTAEQVVNHKAFDKFLDEILNGYSRMVKDLIRRFPRLKILAHGYDRVLPRKNGKWLGKPLASKRIPEALWNDILAILIDELNVGLKSLEAKFPGNFYHVDCRGSVGGSKSQWNDELHPKDPGYARAANRFIELIRALTRNTTEELLSTEALSATPQRVITKEASTLSKQEISNPEQAREICRGMTLPNLRENLLMAPSTEAIIADNSHSRAVVPPHTPLRPIALATAGEQADSALAEWRSLLDDTDREAYRHWDELMKEIDEPESSERLAARRELMHANDVFSLERIIGDSEIFQANFLSRGSRAALSVGRITVMSPVGISLGFGTGFLVAPGILLTNHHVISKREHAANSYILFDYEYDEDNGLKQTVRFDLSDKLYVSSRELDFAFVAVEKQSRDGHRELVEFGHLFLIRESGKAIKREPVSILQHASGLPKQIAMRNSTIIGRREDFVYYTSDTNSGSSGSPVLTDEWFPVALHHRAVPDFNRPRSYVANRGIRISSIYRKLEDMSERGDHRAAEILKRIEPGSEDSSSHVPKDTFDYSASVSSERNVEPFHEIPYDNRTGYDDAFLGICVPRPRYRLKDSVSFRNDNKSPLIDYEHFTVVMHKARRLPLFSASNVDAHPDRKKPETGYIYTRKGLSGLGDNDREKWFKDPRVPDKHQLPDRFFTKDNAAFDKGHNVRRDDVAWGATFEEVRRANGDTYHTTNCTPQVAGFNRSMLGGIWGQLENIVLKQAKTERYCVFSGPVLDPSDRSFRGKDNYGEILVQIPSKYWKVIIALEDDSLKTFAFLLEQDLSQTPLEFIVDAEWTNRMISIPELETILREVVFDKLLHSSDQIETSNAESLRNSNSIELFSQSSESGY